MNTNEYVDFDEWKFDPDEQKAALERMRNNLSEILNTKGRLTDVDIRREIGIYDDYCGVSSENVIISTKRYEVAKKAAIDAAQKAYQQTFNEVFNNYIGES